MAEMPGSPAAPQGAAPQGGSPAGGQPERPMGSSPATQPTQNAGLNMQGLQILMAATKFLERAIPLLGAGTEPGKAAIEALGKLAKHIQPVQGDVAGTTNQMDAMRRTQAQSGSMIAAMRQQQGAPAGGAAPQNPAASAAA
jgi:hypothetical protein